MGRKYELPPVVEALCEIFFEGSKWDSTLPGLFFDQIRQDYPNKKEIEQIGLEFSMSKEVQGSRVSRGNSRIQFINENNSQLIQIEKDLLVINQLRPYPRFVDWKPVIDKMLGIYLKLVQPNVIKRMGIRYINKVVIPLATFKMEDYFYLYPEVPSTLGARHGKFMMRLEIPPKHQQGHTLMVTFSTAPADSSETYAIMFDLYDIIALTREISNAEVENCIIQAHENIEMAFENSITEKTRKLFKEEKN